MRLFLVLLLAVAGLSARGATFTFPIDFGQLGTDLDGNSKAITNAGTVAATLFSGSGASLTGVPLSGLAQDGAETNQVPKWNGVAWVPAWDLTGGSNTVGVTSWEGLTGDVLMTRAHVTNVLSGTITNPITTGGAIVAGSLAGATLSLDSGSIYNDGGEMIFGGGVTAGAFIGNGNAVTDLDAANLSSNTVPLARISGLTTNQVATATDALYRDRVRLIAGTGITIGTNSLESGTLTAYTIAAGPGTNVIAPPVAQDAWQPDQIDYYLLTYNWDNATYAELPVSYDGELTITGDFAGGGSGITNLNADYLISGVVPLGRLAGVSTNQIAGPTDTVYRDRARVTAGTGIAVTETLSQLDTVHSFAVAVSGVTSNEVAAATDAVYREKSVVVPGSGVTVATNGNAYTVSAAGAALNIDTFAYVPSAVGTSNLFTLPLSTVGDRLLVKFHVVSASTGGDSDNVLECYIMAHRDATYGIVDGEPGSTTPPVVTIVAGDSFHGCNANVLTNAGASISFQITDLVANANFRCRGFYTLTSRP